MTNICLNVSNLTKNYGDIKAVRGISLQVPKACIFGMLGPNGAGKTTTIESIVGLTRRDGGNIIILGYNPDKEMDTIRQLIGVQLQSPAIFPGLTVQEVIELIASFYPVPLATTEVLAMTGLEKSKNIRVRGLSGGQKHRLAVGMALIGNGELIFLDEPTTGLDPAARRKLWNVIIDLKEKGKTVFLTTHYMDEAEKICDQLVIIDQGQIIEQGSPQNLLKKHHQENLEDLFLNLTGRRMEYEYENERVL